MSLKTLLATAGLLAIAPAARAQVLITELQPNVIGGDDLGEWIEIQNLGTATVSVAGWTLSDSSAMREVLNRYALPGTASVAPGQVILITRQATQFRRLFPMAPVPNFELADGADDPAVPNITRTGMGNILQLSNTGDAIYLRDAMGTLVSGVEYGNNDAADIAGAPFPTVPNPETGPVPNGSLTRVMITNNTQVDFTDRYPASPGVGYNAASGPQITNVASLPRHAIYGRPYTITASVTSNEMLRNVSLFFAAATSSAGAAMEEYAELTPTRSGTATYAYSANVEAFAPGHGFGPPANFHERFVRWFITAVDAVGASATEPVMATEAAENTFYRPRYVQNVLPEDASPIADAREEAAAGGPRWRNFSVRVRGTAVVAPTVMNPGRFQFALVDGSNAGITVFDTAIPADAFTFGPGAVIEVTGTINDFRGLTQIGQSVEVVPTGAMAAVPTTTVTVQELLMRGNALESQLVHIRDLTFMAPRATWPDDAMASGSWNVRATDGTGEITLRVTPGAQGLFGEAAPQYGFHLTGVVGQFDMTWQVFPRGAADVVAKPAPPMPDAGANADATPGADGSTTPGRDAGTSGRADASGDPFVPPVEDGGCGCSAGGAGATGSAALWIAMVLIGAALARRRR